MYYLIKDLKKKKYMAAGSKLDGEETLKFTCITKDLFTMESMEQAAKILYNLDDNGVETDAMVIVILSKLELLETGGVIL
jgi:hypothetical protein